MEVVRNLIYVDNTTVIVGTKLIEIMERVRKTSKETSLYRNVLDDVTVDGEMVCTAQVWTWPPASAITIYIRRAFNDRKRLQRSV